MSWKAVAKRFDEVGSRVTCDPPPTDTDKDILVLVDDMWDSAFGEWDCESEEHYNGEEALDFVSYRQGNTNLIVTDSEAFYDNFMVATRVAKKLNLTKKRDRVALFRAILYREG